MTTPKRKRKRKLSRVLLDLRVRFKKSEEPQSFLSMYFRDMAELEVLRPEQEFETARHIEELELGLWRVVLSFHPVGRARSRDRRGCHRQASG